MNDGKPAELASPPVFRHLAERQGYAGASTDFLLFFTPDILNGTLEHLLRRVGEISRILDLRHLKGSTSSVES
jgi:hypothetical protein